MTVAARRTASNELHALSIAEASDLMRRKALSPVELTDALLARIEALDPQLNAFLLPTPEKAREQAGSRARDHGGQVPRAAARHAVRGEGHLCDGRHPHHQPLEDLRRPRPDRRCNDRNEALRGRRGAARQAATHEFAHGGPSFDLPWPPARNPWNRDHFTGGSSSGAGAGVAAGLVPGSARLRYRRLDPRPRRAVRHRRSETDLRPGQPRRRLCQFVHLRSCRPDDLDGRGLRDHAAGDRRPRSEGSGERHASDPGLPGGADRRHPRIADRRRAPSVRGRHAVAPVEARRSTRPMPCFARSAPRSRTCASGRRGLLRRQDHDRRKRAIRHPRGGAAHSAPAISAPTSSAARCLRCSTAAPITFRRSASGGSCWRRWRRSTSKYDVLVDRRARDRRPGSAPGGPSASGRIRR